MFKKLLKNVIKFTPIGIAAKLLIPKQKGTQIATPAPVAPAAPTTPQIATVDPAKMVQLTDARVTADTATTRAEETKKKRKTAASKALGGVNGGGGLAV